jgi:hypothetical protein
MKHIRSISEHLLNLRKDDIVNFLEHIEDILSDINDDGFESRVFPSSKEVLVLMDESDENWTRDIGKTFAKPVGSFNSSLREMISFNVMFELQDGFYYKDIKNSIAHLMPFVREYGFDVYQCQYEMSGANTIVTMAMNAFSEVDFDTLPNLTKLDMDLLVVRFKKK